MFLIALINNLALLIALSVISGFIKQHVRQNIWPGQVVQGVLFGVVAVIAMLNPLRFSPGVIFDGRTIMVSLAGFFFGPLAAVPAALLPMTYRTYLGGDGVWMGLLTILSSAGLGVFYYYHNLSRQNPPTTGLLLRFGLLVHVVMLALMSTLPNAIIADVFLQVGPLVLILFPIVTVIIGKVLIGQDEAEVYLAHLEQSEQRQRLALEGGSLGAWDWHAVGDRLIVNERYTQMLGLSPGEGPTILRDWEDRLHPNDRPAALGAFQAHLDGRAPMFEREFRLRHKNGSWVWVLSVGRVIERDAAGRALRVSGTHLDINERKLVEDEREVTVRLLALLNASTNQRDLIQEVTALLQNWSGCEAVGIRLQEGADFPYYETRGFPASFVQTEASLCTCNLDGTPALDENGLPLLECMCGTVIRGRTDPSQSFFTLHGSFWTNSTSDLLAATTERERMGYTRNRCNMAGYESVALIALHAGGETLGLLQFNDRRRNCFTAEQIAVMERLSESLAIGLAQRNAQAAMRESEARYRTLVENVGEGIGYIDGHDTIAFANHAAGKILGVPPEALVGRSFKELISPDHMCMVEANFGQYPEGSESAVEVRRDDGARRILRVNAVSQRDAQGGLQGLFVVFRDVTEKVENEQLLKRYRALAESSRDIMWFVRLSDGKIMEANQAACQVYGYTREEFLNLNIDQLRSPSMKKLTAASLNNAAEKDLIFETLHMRKSGEVFPVEVSTRGAMIDGERVVLSVIRDISERKRAEARIADQIARLSALQAIDNAIIQNLELPLVLDVIINQVRERLGVKCASIWLVNDHNQLDFAGGRSICAFEGQGRLALGQGNAGQIAARRMPIWLPDVRSANGSRPCAPVLQTDCPVVGYYGAPLVSKGKLLGVLETYHDQPLEVDEDWISFFNVLAGQAAIAIDDTNMTAGLHASHDELLHAYEATIEGWSRALDLRDHETEGHSQRVTDMSVALARELGFSEEELLQVRRGALLHDIGKMGVPDPILLKPGALTPEEWEIMRRHPSYAYELLLPIEFLHPALDIPHCHHEKWDGSGYPRGLRGEAIPLAARIFAVVDVYDALTSDRPYRPAWTPAQTCAFLQEQAGSHFDPRVVEAFLRMFEKKGLLVAA